MLGHLLSTARRKGWLLRSADQVSRLASLDPAFDLRGMNDRRMSYAELMTLRHQHRLWDPLSKGPTLHLIEDKLLLRTATAQKIPAAKFSPFYVLTRNSSMRLWPHLRGKGAFVARPTHLTQSRYVLFGMPRKGRDLVSYTQVLEIEKMLRPAWNELPRAVGDTREARQLSPGLLVDRLISSSGQLEVRSGLRTDEVKCMTAWGRVVAAEWLLHEHLAYQGSVFMTRTGNLKKKWEMLPEPKDLILAGQISNAFISYCLPLIVRLAETIAVQGGYDFIRVDVLIEGYCKELFVNELSFFPTQRFSTLATESIGAAWTHGYSL